MKNILLPVLFVLAFSSTLAQNIDYTKYRYYEEPKELQKFFSQSVLFGDNIISRSNDADENDFVTISKLNFETKKSEHRFFSEFAKFELNQVNTIGDLAYAIVERGDAPNKSAELYTYTENKSTKEIEETKYTLDILPNFTQTSNLFKKNDSLLLLTSKFEYRNPDNKTIAYRVYYANPDNNKLERIKTISSDVNEFNLIETNIFFAKNGQFDFIGLLDENPNNAFILGFNINDFTVTKKAINNPFISFALQPVISRSLTDEENSIRADLIKHQPSNTRKLVLSGWNLENNTWFYSDEDKLLEQDSLSFIQSRMFFPTLNQLPNGDYIATASVFERHANDWFFDKLGYQRTLLQVFSNGQKPKLKAAYFYELPNGSNIESSIILPDSTILLIGSGQSDDGIYSAVYLNIGKGSAVGINENESSQTLKYSLINQGQSLRLFNPHLNHTEIYDANGRLLLEQYGNDQMVDISKLSPALYILRTQNQGESHYQMTNFLKP